MCPKMQYIKRTRLACTWYYTQSVQTGPKNISKTYQKSMAVDKPALVLVSLLVSDCDSDCQIRSEKSSWGDGDTVYPAGLRLILSIVCGQGPKNIHLLYLLEFERSSKDILKGNLQKKIDIDSQDF